MDTNITIEIVSVIGARPQFVKSAIVSQALRDAGFIERVVHSGQHYDYSMSGRFLDELGVSVDANLAAGSGDHARQTAQIMMGFQEYLETLDRLPAAIVVFGDTNSTVATALVAAKLSIPIVHVEAGLRSFNRQMPEEVNRVLTDHMSNLLFCSSHEGKNNLAREGITAGVHVVGDVMFDAFEHFSNRTKPGQSARSVIPNLNSLYILLTLHRPTNTDNPDFLRRLREILVKIDTPIIWPVHPRFRKAVAAAGMPNHVFCIEPVGYFDMLDLLRGCAHVITDSGGLQKEAYWARRPCITMRDETEWVETLQGSWNVLANLDSDLPSLLSRQPQTDWAPLYGDGKSCARIAEILKNELA